MFLSNKIYIYCNNSIRKYKLQENEKIAIVEIIFYIKIKRNEKKMGILKFTIE